MRTETRVPNGSALGDITAEMFQIMLTLASRLLYSNTIELSYYQQCMHVSMEHSQGLNFNLYLSLFFFSEFTNFLTYVTSI